MTISGIYAAKDQETEGIISTDIVDIEIKSFKLNDNQEEMEYPDDEKQVTPGEEVSIIPTVFNKGTECYLRIKIQYINDDVDFIDYVTGFSEDFVKYGDYYYYSKVLKPNESVKIFDNIKIPEDIRDKIDSNKFKLEIIAEAIQGRNFEPDYTLTDPWKNVKPEKTVNNTYDIDDKNSKILINYEDGTDNDIFVPNNFFEKARKMVPGDTATDLVEIKNTSHEKAKYYLEINTDKNNEQELKLLESLKLTISTSKGQVLYNGNFLSTGKIPLGEYKLGEGEILSFTVVVPLELNNQYENLNSKLLLIFSGEYEGKATPSHDGGTIKTGDLINASLITFLISSLGLIVVMLLYHRENKNK